MASRKASTPRAAPRRRRRPIWVDLPDDELLQWRICELDLSIEGTLLATRVERLYEELELRGLRFRPHFWLSDDWFAPDGVPGVAIPFYMAHPRLARLERNQMLEVEGWAREWCLRILRHETGHAIDTAFRLHRRRRWQEVFGKNSQPYPDHYQPKPYSKSYVLHLEQWYAQSHPAEDFAETFAVWLKPRSRWRTEYHGWPALKKLEYVDEVMDELRMARPVVGSRERVDPVRKLRKTLKQHYEEKRERYGIGGSCIYDRSLMRLFATGKEGARGASAAAFLKRHRRALRQTVANWTGQYQYTIDQVLGEMIDRCKELKLRLTEDEDRSYRDAEMMLTVQTMNFLRNGRHKVVL